MYAKLVFRNAKRSVKDYLIYIVTMTICVTLFYSFLSISSRYYQPDIGSEYNFTILSDGMKAAICVITLFLLFLIRFVNHYMLRRKQKEFAVQSIMGMGQKTVGRLFFAETFMMGILSIAIGIFLGVFCSQFITAMLLTTYGKSYELSWTLFPDTVLLTIGFFIFSFLIVGIFNTRTIRKTKIIDMLAAEKENDPELKKSRWIAAVVLLFEGFTVWMLLTGVQKIVFYYDGRFAIPAKLMFWGNILFPAITLLWSGFWLIRKRKTGVSTLLPGLLVCTVLNTVMAASVPALTSRYYLALGAGAINQYLLFLLIDLLFFICCVIYLSSSFIVAWKAKAPEHRYKGENLFFFGQITSKLNTTSKTMTLICVTLVLAIFMFIAAPILVGWASGYLDPGDCDGQSGYGVSKLDSIVEEVVRQIFAQFREVSRKKLLESVKTNDAARIQKKIKKIQKDLEAKQKELDDLKAETILVIRGISALDKELLGTLVAEAREALETLEKQLVQAQEEYEEATKTAKRSNYICNELFTWADVYDTANHDERRAILQQFIKEIRVRKDYEVSITLNASFNQVEQLKAVSTYDGAEIFEGISERGA